MGLLLRPLGFKLGEDSVEDGAEGRAVWPIAEFAVDVDEGTGGGWAAVDADAAGVVADEECFVVAGE